MKSLGYSLNSAEWNELQEARRSVAHAERILGQVRGRNRLHRRIGKLTILGFTCLQRDVYVAADENADVTYVIPKEGSTLWIDNMTIAKGAPKRRAVKLS